LARNPLPVKFLGSDITLANYLLLGFRFVNLSGVSEPSEVVERSRELEVRAGVSVARAVESAFPLNNWFLPDKKGLKQCLASLRNPEKRFRQELFWPWLEPGQYRCLADAAASGPQAVAAAVRDQLDDDPDNLAHQHATAVLLHACAVNNEMALLAARRPDGEFETELWLKALTAWSNVFRSPRLKQHVAGRVKELKHLREGELMADRVLEQLPAVIVAMQTQMASNWVLCGEPSRAGRLLGPIRETGLLTPEVSWIVVKAAQQVVEDRLDGLHEKTKEWFFWEDRDYTGSVLRSRWKRLRDEAMKLYAFLTEELGLSRENADRVSFGRLVEPVISAAFGVANREKNTRAVLRSLIIMEDLQECFPLAAADRQKVAGKVDHLRDVLTEGMDEMVDVDPTQCWFLKGQRADPDCSMQVELVRETSTTIQTRRILIPRSADARALHESGESELAMLSAGSSDPEVRKLLSSIESDRMGMDHERDLLEEEAEEEKEKWARKLPDMVRQRKRKAGVLMSGMREEMSDVARNCRFPNQAARLELPVFSVAALLALAVSRGSFEPWACLWYVGMLAVAGAAAAVLRGGRVSRLRRMVALDCEHEIGKAAGQVPEDPAPGIERRLRVGLRRVERASASSAEAHRDELRRRLCFRGEEDWTSYPVMEACRSAGFEVRSGPN